MTDIHSSAAAGFSRAGEAYVSGRPGYPAGTGDWLSEELDLGSGQTVIDLGAGTGKFTRHLVDTGAHVIAIEPVEEMLAQCRRACPEAEQRIGSAASIPLEDSSADALFCAQAFHWFASPEALTEIARVLRLDGVFGLIWNVRDETCPWVAELSRIMQPYEEGTPRFHEGQWRRLFPAPEFGSLQERQFTHVHSGSFESVVVNRILSVSFIAALPEEERSSVRAKIHALREMYPELDDPSGVSFPYTTITAWMRKLSA